MKQFHEQKQFHVNVYYNSSWCLFKMRTHQQGGDDNFEDDMDYQSDPSDEGGVKINRDEDQEMMEEDRAAERERTIAERQSRAARPLGTPSIPISGAARDSGNPAPDSAANPPAQPEKP